MVISVTVRAMAYVMLVLPSLVVVGLVAVPAVWSRDERRRADAKEVLRTLWRR